MRQRNTTALSLNCWSSKPVILNRQLYELDTLIFPEIVHIPCIALTYGNEATRTDVAMYFVSVYLFRISDAEQVNDLIRKTKMNKGRGFHKLFTKNYIVCIMYEKGGKELKIFDREVKKLVPELKQVFSNNFEQL